MEYAKQAERHREIAEWYRTLADNSLQETLRGSYRELAGSYDRLAKGEFQLANRYKRAH